jgi:putative ABC transport system ATP-binding protein
MLEAVELTRRTTAGVFLLNGISLSIKSGERWAVVGPTGSGKTLLLRALAILDAVDSGEVRWQGQTVPDAEVPAYRRKVVYLHQRPALVEGTVEDNLRLPWGFKALKEPGFRSETVLHLLGCIGRGADFLTRQSRQLSGGERQIVALLRALQLEPQVLLLDEPTAALDYKSTASVEEIVQTYLKESPVTRASVWVTHDLDQVPLIADWQLSLHAGQAEEPKHVG